MHSFMTYDLARQHQETYMREAAYERKLRDARKPAKRLSTQLVVLQQTSLSEGDFAAIRRDLRSILSEWSLEPGTTGCEAVIDTFIYRLKMRLRYGERGHKTRATL